MKELARVKVSMTTSAFHRVIDGFMAQTGDVQPMVTWKTASTSAWQAPAAPIKPDLPAEFSKRAA